MWGNLPTGALAPLNKRKAQQKSLRKPSQAQKYTGGNVRKIYGVLYAVALVERISAFRAEFRRMRRIGGLPAALVAAVDRRSCRTLCTALGAELSGIDRAACACPAH